MTTFLDELLGYVDMSADDVARLAALHDRLAPHFSAIATRFYDAVQANPRTAAILADPRNVDRLHLTLIDWLSTGLRGPYDEAFYEKRSRIGRRHVQIGLPHQFMFTAMTVVRLGYQEHVQQLYPADEAFRVMSAVHKLLDVELAIMVRHYQLDSDDKLIARERRMQADRISAMQTMTAGLAHEVRNPLNAAKLQLELLERRLRRAVTDARLIEPTTLAQMEIDRLTQLLEDFLAFARPPELVLQDRDVADLVRLVGELERPNADKRGIGFTVELPAEPVTARVDGGKLHQVIDNLLRNAIEAVDEGGRVKLALTADHDAFTIVVEDDGPGIPTELQARIYEPFFTTKDVGTGLGMSIVHSLVALHDGRISLASGVPGARFEVSIPRRR